MGKWQTAAEPGQWSNWHVTAWKMEAEKQEAEKHAEWKHGRRQADKHGSRGVLEALPHLAAMPSPRRARCPMVAEIWEQGQGPPGAAMKSLGRRNPNWCWTSPILRPQASGRQPQRLPVATHASHASSRIPAGPTAQSPRSRVETSLGLTSPWRAGHGRGRYL